MHRWVVKHCVFDTVICCFFEPETIPNTSWRTYVLSENVLLMKISGRFYGHSQLNSFADRKSSGLFF